MSENKNLEQVKHLLDTAEDNIRTAKNILFAAEISERAKKNLTVSEPGTIEGVFNGESMVDANDKVYLVPANYASKSKLVYGDILKLSILADGTYLYKQIGPVRRKKVVGELVQTGTNKYAVRSADAEYRVLPASVTYFKADTGDKLTILLPEEAVSEWAAVENRIA